MHIIRRRIAQLLLVLIVVCSPAYALADAGIAPRLSLIPSSSNPSVRSTVIIDVVLDTVTPVNAFDIQLTYPADILSPVSFDASTSIVDLWQTKDLAAGNGMVSLVGGMASPFSGTHGDIMKVKFKVLAAGSATLGFGTTSVYYADGSGTAATAILSGTTIGKPVEPPAVVVVPVTTPAPVTPPAPVAPTKTPVVAPSPVETPVASVPVYGAAASEYSMRTMQWFTYSPWQSVTTFEPVGNGIWRYEIARSIEGSEPQTQTFYVPNEIGKKLGGVAVGVALIIISYMLTSQWLKKRHSKASS